MYLKIFKAAYKPARTATLLLLVCTLVSVASQQGDGVYPPPLIKVYSCPYLIGCLSQVPFITSRAPSPSRLIASTPLVRCLRDPQLGGTRPPLTSRALPAHIPKPGGGSGRVAAALASGDGTERRADF